MEPSTKKHRGSCHCGAIRFEVDLETSKGATRCNCSICTKTAWMGMIVKPEAFVLLTPESASLASYAFGGKTMQRYFCRTCGIQCFGRGHLEQLGGDYVSVNVSCLDDVDPSTLDVVYWDGRHDNWQAGPRKTPWPISA